MNRRILIALAAVFALVSVLLAVSGGFRVTVGGFRLSARSPWPAAAIATAALGIWFLRARAANTVAKDLELAWSSVDRRAASIVTAIAIASGVAAAFQFTFSPAAADASGYLSEARMFASGRLSYTDTLTAIVGGWPTGLTAPLGWLPGAVEGFQTPTYPPGLPLLMAIPHWAGGTVAACWVVIVSAAIAVWSTGRIGVHLAGGPAGIVAALTMATVPVFLYQSVQPMSDVPVTAAWMLCWRLVLSGSGNREAGAAGIACAIAVLIRPNLAPLAIVPLFFTGRRVAFAAPVAVAGLLLAWLQWYWYGSPLRSGYGSAGEIFSLANIAPNAAFYARWLLATTPIMVLGVAGFWFARAERVTRALAAFSALVVGAYLIYAVFADWSYLRFLLPALAIGSVFVGVTAARMIAGLPAAARAAVLLTAGVAIATAGIANARALSAFDLDTQHGRIVRMADRLRETMTIDAVIVAGEQSGSMRYATGRPILRWEAASPADLTRALAALEGRDIWIVLDGFEHELFRKKFSPAAAGELDWPPAIVAGTRTTAWRLSDRDRFVRGEHVPTERLP